MILKKYGHHSQQIKYWEDSNPVNYSGGPVSDKSGRLILFAAENLEAARELALNDPFIVGEVIESNWIKKWIQ